MQISWRFHSAVHINIFKQPLCAASVTELAYTMRSLVVILGLLVTAVQVNTFKIQIYYCNIWISNWIMNICGSEHAELRTEVTCQYTHNTEGKWHVIRELKYISNKNYFILVNNSLALKPLKPNLLSSMH
jgi:hypothetical protein